MIELYIHKPPMKAMLYCIARCYSLENALKIVNKEMELELTEENVIKWGHIPEKEAYEKLNKQTIELPKIKE